MLDRLAIAVTICAGLTAHLHAQTSALPPSISKKALDVCGDGRPAKMAAGALQSGDLNGDGQLDYVVDEAKVQCPDGPVADCGSGGCSIQAYVSSSKGYRAIDLGILGFNPRIKTETSPPTLVVSQRTGHAVSYRWTGRTLKQVR